MSSYAPEAESGISARWYVMVTSASGRSVFAMMGPYPAEADAKQAADVGRVVHYRIGRGEVRTPPLRWAH